MAIYYIAIAVSVFSGLYLCEKKSEKRLIIFYLIFSGLILTAIASLRYAIGFDYYSYRSIYLESANQSLFEILKKHPQEILFYLLNWLCSHLGLSYTAFLFVLTSFIHLVAMRFLYQYSKIPWLSIFLYFTLQFLAHNMNLLRQSLGVTFFLLAFPYLLKKKFLPYLFYMILGGLFHTSAFFMIPLYFLLRLDNTYRTMAICTIFFGVFYFLIDPALEIICSIFPKYSFYLNSIYWQANSARYLILPSLYFLFVLFFRTQLLAKDNQNAIYINSALYTLLIHIFITKHFILERFSIYPFILSLLLLPEIVTLERKTKDSSSLYSKKAIFLLSLTLLFGLGYFSFAINEGFHNVYPYVSLFDRASSNKTP